MSHYVLSQLASADIENILNNGLITENLGMEVIGKLWELYVLREGSHDIRNPDHGRSLTKLGTPSEWSVEINDHQRTFLR